MHTRLLLVIGTIAGMLLPGAQPVAQAHTGMLLEMRNLRAGEESSGRWYAELDVVSGCADLEQGVSRCGPVEVELVYRDNNYRTSSITKRVGRTGGEVLFSFSPERFEDVLLGRFWFEARQQHCLIPDHQVPTLPIPLPVPVDLCDTHKDRLPNSGAFRFVDYITTGYVLAPTAGTDEHLEPLSACSGRTPTDPWISTVLELPARSANHKYTIYEGGIGFGGYSTAFWDRHCEGTGRGGARGVVPKRTDAVEVYSVTNSFGEFIFIVRSVFER